MSRGFWTVIGIVAGFYVGGLMGVGLAHATFDCCYGETMYPFFGGIVGAIIGAAVAVYLTFHRC